MSRPLRISALLFGSGMTALIYQVAWMRELRLVFGFSTAASAAVVAIFMGGLGIGGWLLGRRADLAPQPLAFYGWLEIAVAISAAVTPALLWLVRAAYIAVGGSLRLGIAGGSVVRLLLSAIVLAAPTVLMGGTLPAATRAAETDEDAGRRYLALLYGSNTLGAVAGTLLSTFYLLERLGTRETLWAACLVNVAVGLAAVLLSRAVPAAVSSIAESAPVNPSAVREGQAPPLRHDVGPSKKSASKQRRADRRAGIAPPPPEPPVAVVTVTVAVAVPERFVLGAAAITGFVFTLMELVWYRMLGPLLGGSTYTFGLILAVALFGIGAGSLARSRSKRPGTLSGFAATCAIEALVLAVPYGLGDSVAILAARLRPEGAFTFGQLVSGWTIVAGLVVFPAAFVAGYQFPVLISLLGRGREKVGAQVGLAYAWNTAGAIVGSLAGGFGLLPLLSATGTWIFVTVLLAVLALASVAVSRSRGESGPKALWVPLAGAAAGVALLFTTGPTAAWRHSPIGAGRVNLSKASPNRIEEWVRDQRRRTFWEKDGVESSVAMTTTSGGLAFVVNGKIDGNTRTDAPTQVMGGLIGAAVHPGPRSALVIGLGTGSTAGWLASVPSIERVDVVELEPAILKVADRSAPVNRNVLANPKVKVTIRDAREYLLTSKDRYDLIFSEPSNPYRAGISSLFTADFYAAARDRLAPGGIFLQWLQSYEVVPETVRSVYATLQTAFPVIESWFSRDRDLILAASAAPITYDADALRARLAEEPFRSAMLDAWTTEGLEGLLSHYVARSSLVPALLAAGPAPKNTDDRNVIEFAFARSLGSQAAFDLDSARALARERHEDAPPLAKGSADWNLVRRLRISTITADGVAPRERPDMTAEEIRQCRAQKAFLEGHPENALDLWREKPWEPVGPVELAVVSQALAFAGDESASGYIGRLSVSRPVDALILLGELRWRQGRFPEAADLYEKALTRYREDPWALLPVVNRSFTIVADLAGRDRALAGKMDAALSQPFAVLLLNEERLQTRYKVATFLDQSKLEDAIAALEPYVPWRKGLLSRRARLYETTRNPLAAKAQRELEAYLKNEVSSPTPASNE